MRALLVFLVAIFLPTAAFAHAGHGDASGLVHGFMHPVGGLDHILAMMAVGVFAAVLGGRALWLVPLSFVGMMLAGFALGLAGVAVPFVEVGIALSSIVIGGAAAIGRPMPVAAAMSLVGVFAVFHGHAHGAEMPQSVAGLEYAAGFVVATALLHAAGIGVAAGVAGFLGRWGRVAARFGGVAFAVGGVGVLTGWF